MKKLFFFLFLGLFVFSAQKIEWMNDLRAFPWERKKNKKHKNPGKKTQTTFTKKKWSSS